MKVTPIRLKKYYCPSAVQSAECGEFLVSLSEDNSQSQCNGSVQTALTNVNVDGKNLMGQTGDANTVNNQDNAGPKGSKFKY